jgi:phage shock protein A
LQLAANNLLDEIPILTDCIEIRRYHAKRIHELKDEKSKLETKLEELEQKHDTSEAKLKILKARIDAVEDFDGLEALLKQYKKDNVSLGQEAQRWRWKAAEAERRTANAIKAELCVLRRAWNEMCDDRG